MAHFVVEDFSRSTGQCAEAVIAQHFQIIRQRHSGELNSEHNLHGRKGVNVHLRDGRFHRAEDIAIVKGRKTAGQTALNADFAGAEFPGLNGFFRDLLRLEEVGVGFARASAEGAELATNETDVGEVNISVYDVGDYLPREFIAKEISGNKQT